MLSPFTILMCCLLHSFGLFLNCIKILFIGASVIAQWIRACTALMEGLSSVSSTHVRQLATVETLALEGSSFLLWSPQIHALMCIHTHTTPHTHKNK